MNPRPDKPADVIEGPHPNVGIQSVRVTAYECSGCRYRTLTRQQAEEHRYWGHPAYRYPEICCQAAPMWDHERWCVRAKGHDGDHWTPNINGGVGWPQHPVKVKRP